jgi:polar amino acid transport system substrate-binding protein
MLMEGNVFPRLVLCLVLGWGALVHAASAPELVLNNVNNPPYTNVQKTGFLDRVGQAAFQRCGLRLRLVRLPPERGLRNANAGIEDGDLTRIAGIEDSYPNLIRVPEKLIDWQFSAFTYRHDLSVPAHWKSLLPYTVGIIRGWKIAETNLGTAKKLVLVDDVDQLFRLLEKRRVDAVVYSREMGLWYLHEHGLRDVQRLEPPLESREMFIYLNKKHAERVAPLAAALRSLKQDGTYERIYRASMAPVPDVLP